MGDISARAPIQPRSSVLFPVGCAVSKALWRREKSRNDKVMLRAITAALDAVEGDDSVNVLGPALWCSNSTLRPFNSQVLVVTNKGSLASRALPPQLDFYRVWA